MGILNRNKKTEHLRGIFTQDGLEMVLEYLIGEQVELYQGENLVAGHLRLVFTPSEDQYLLLIQNEKSFTLVGFDPSSCLHFKGESVAALLEKYWNLESEQPPSYNDLRRKWKKEC